VIKNERPPDHESSRREVPSYAQNELAATPLPKHIPSKFWEARQAGLTSQLQDVEAGRSGYRTLKTGGPKILELDYLEGLPIVLIQADIGAGLTQEERADAFGDRVVTAHGSSPLHRRGL